MANNNPLQIINNRNDIDTLIQATDIKTYTTFYANIEDSQFKPHILAAQETYLRITLGDTLYKELLAEWILANGNANLLPDGSTLPNGTNYKELYKRLKMYLIYQSAVIMLPFLAIKITEKGLEFQSSEFSQNGELSAMNELEKRYEVLVKRQETLLLEYIDKTFNQVRQEIIKEAEVAKPFLPYMYVPQYKNKC